MEEQAPISEGSLFNFKPSSSIQFCDGSSKVVFLINKDGCHVPLGVSADEAAQVVIKRLDDHIKNLVKSLEKENAQLKAKIADGIRVYASKDKQGYAVVNYFGIGPRNATLLLDKGE